MERDTNDPGKTECMIVTWCGAEIEVHPNVMERLGLAASQEIDCDMLDHILAENAKERRSEEADSDS